MNDLKMLRGKIKNINRSCSRILTHKYWSKKFAAICHGRNISSDLEWCDLKTILANRTIVCITNAPWVTGENFLLPLGAWDHATLLVWQANTSFFSKAKRPHIFLYSFYAKTFLVTQTAA